MIKLLTTIYNSKGKLFSNFCPGLCFSMTQQCLISTSAWIAKKKKKSITVYFTITIIENYSNNATVSLEVKENAITYIHTAFMFPIVIVETI